MHRMRTVHIVGRQNHGKTSLTAELVEEFRRRGLRVGTIKHSSHAHELDTPGKDSFRHRQAGANPAAVVTKNLIGLYLPPDAETGFCDQLAPMFAACDLVLIEGHIDGSGIKIEVWREALGDSCLAAERDDIAAVVTDDRPQLDVPIWPRSNVGRLSQRILDLR